MAELTAKHYVDALISQKKKIISGTLFCVALAALVTLFLPNIYQTKSILYLYLPNTKTEFLPSDVSINMNQGMPKEQAFSNFSGFFEDEYRHKENKELINIVGELAKSPEMLKQLIDTVGLKKVSIEDLNSKILHTEVLKITTVFSGHLYAPLISLSAEFKDKKIVAELVNTWAGFLKEKINEVFSIRFKRLHQSILNGLEDSKKELLIKEKALADFKKSSRISALEIALEAKKSDFLAINTALNELNMAKRKKGTMARSEEEPAIQEKGRLLDLLSKAKEELLRLQTDLYEEEFQLLQLQKEIDIKRMDYELLERKSEQFKFLIMEGLPEASIAAKAVEPLNHIRPKRGLIMLTAGVLGLLMMCFFSLLKRI